MNRTPKNFTPPVESPPPGFPGGWTRVLGTVGENGRVILRRPLPPKR